MNRDKVAKIEAEIVETRKEIEKKIKAKNNLDYEISEWTAHLAWLLAQLENAKGE